MPAKRQQQKPANWQYVAGVEVGVKRDVRETQSYRTLVRCLVRRIQAERQAVLDRCPRKGPIATDADRQASIDLAAADEALTKLGQFDTQ